METKLSTLLKADAKQITAAKRRKMVFVNAGHRGPKTGAVGFLDEGTEAIFLRTHICRRLKELGHVSIKDDDKAVLSSVVKNINSMCDPDDICIDIHFNAASVSATGTECFVRKGARVVEKDLAIDICDKISSLLRIKNRGVKTDDQGQHSRLAMCSDIKCNAVLIEVCFITNETDVKRYSENRIALAESIAGCISKVIKK